MKMKGIEPINPKKPSTSLTNLPLAPILHSRKDMFLGMLIKI